MAMPARATTEDMAARTTCSWKLPALSRMKLAKPVASPGRPRTLSSQSGAVKPKTRVRIPRRAMGPLITAGASWADWFSGLSLPKKTSQQSRVM